MDFRGETSMESRLTLRARISRTMDKRETTSAPGSQATAARHMLSAHHRFHPARRWNGTVKMMLDQRLRVVEGETAP